ncbi:MAG: DUF3301 domain-containing protein [Shewanellaceae bacterium]|nr:DUF3301 domain-containing protein [Shewanellaceae bacterium]
MDMGLPQIIFLMLLCTATAWYWLEKKIENHAIKIARKACKKQNVKYIQCIKYRSKIYLKPSYQFGLYHEYLFEFSERGFDKFQGHIIFKGQHFKSIHWPAMND